MGKKYGRKGAEKNVGETMSWWSDREPFNEYDPPWCKNCKGGNSYEECKRCTEWHREEIEGNERGTDKEE